MSCYHPLRAVILPGKTDSGKKNVKIIGSATSENKYCYQHRSHSDSFDFSEHVFESPYWRQLETMLVPCGQCVGCRLDYSRRWATRLMLELPYHENSYFVTLTYNDDYLPIGDQGLPTLVPDDVQKFMKRLRKEMSKWSDHKIRFYLCGEYGSTTYRPHYHLIIYGLDLPDGDLVFLKNSQFGDPYYTSVIINKCWPFGFNLVAGVTWQSCAYVARYIMKKQTGEAASTYEEHGIVPEFVRMSRRPGIGRMYYDDHASDMLRNKYIQLSDGLKAPIPRYFDPFFEIDFPEEYEKLSEDRVMTAKLLSQMKEYSTELDYFEQLCVDESVKISKAKMLVRSDL